MTLLLSLALAADPEPPGPRPEGEVTVVDGMVAMPPPLARWYEQRHRYATQLEVAHRAQGLELQAAQLRVSACEIEAEAWAARVEAWERYAERVERRERLGVVRDVGLVALGGAAVFAGGWAYAQL